MFHTTPEIALNAQSYEKALHIGFYPTPVRPGTSTPAMIAPTDSTNAAHVQGNSIPAGQACTLVSYCNTKNSQVDNCRGTN